ncbi:MAG: peptide deformylase [Bacteroidales bacterium]|nr:peptide deformylase [Bacteroidales bacterium]MBD5377671.1 peptide deformylase [Bacteroides sp.]
MKLPVYLYGHPVLRKECEDVTPDYPELKTLIEDMYETMYASEGVGLAAPQIGRNIRLVVIDADPLGDSFPECKGRKMTLINPRVEVLDGEEISRAEGCLSVPGLSEDVKRVEHIRLTWLDADMNPQEEVMDGFLARVVQHECDHLEGQLYIDHLSGIRKQLIRGKLRNILDGKTRCDYPARYAPTAKKGRR